MILADLAFAMLVILIHLVRFQKSRHFPPVNFSQAPPRKKGVDGSIMVEMTINEDMI
jgi:hypothetical protein